MTVETVTGPVALDELGVTLTHEHVICDASAWRSPTPDPSLVDRRVDASLIGRLRHNPLGCDDNLLLRDEQLAVRELEPFRASGGRTIMDPTCVGIGRDVEALRRVSAASGVQIVAGCGYYISSARPAYVEAMSVEELEEAIVRDVTVGVDGTGIRSGFIGEIGITDGSPEVSAYDERVLRGAARAHVRTGVPLMIHLVDLLGDRVLDIVEEEGGHLPGTLLCHMSRTRHDLAYQRRLAARGVRLGYDTFGMDWFVPEMNKQLPADAELLTSAMKLVEVGYGDRLLLSSDVFLKMQLVTFGGFGYAHVIDNVLPRLRRMGVAEQLAHELLVGNARQLFANAAVLSGRRGKSDPSGIRAS